MSEEEINEDLSHRIARASPQNSPRLGLNTLPGKPTVDGFSVHHEQQTLGTLVATISAGQLIGELALLNDQPRSASVRCTSNCEFLVIKGDEFEDVLKEEMFRKGDEKLKFLIEHMPGMRDAPTPKPGGARLHASYYFKKAKFPANHVFFKQGEVSEAKIYVVIRGAIEFSRCFVAATSEEGLLPHPFNCRQRLLGRPKSLPGFGISVGGPKAIAAASLGSWARSMGQETSRQPLGGRLCRNATSSDEQVSTGAPGSGVLTRCGILLSGGVFGSMPLGEPELFTVKATTSSCEVYYITPADFPKLPRRLVDTMKDYTASTTVWRLKNHQNSNEFRNALEGKRLVTASRGSGPPARKLLPREPPVSSRAGLTSMR
jgi:CRP-like cAMP-binding protein